MVLLEHPQGFERNNAPYIFKPAYQASPQIGACAIMSRNVQYIG